MDYPPLHALQDDPDGPDGPNGVYSYGAGGVYPTTTWQGSNYLVDVVFQTQVAEDTTAPQSVSSTPTDGASNVAVGSNLSAAVQRAARLGLGDGAARSSCATTPATSSSAADVTYVNGVAQHRDRPLGRHSTGARRTTRRASRAAPAA